MFSIPRPVMTDVIPLSHDQLSCFSPAGGVQSVRLSQLPAGPRAVLLCWAAGGHQGPVRGRHGGGRAGQAEEEPQVLLRLQV